MTTNLATTPEAGPFSERVEDRARRVVELYLRGEELEQPDSRDQKELIEGLLAPEYHGRTVVELLQNGHDAHPSAREDGILSFVLVANEGEHGALYVANGGNPLGDADFDSLWRIAWSNKNPSEGIGNKGVGFKSVLELTASPEVYSAAEPGTGTLDGYCFRFARPEDFDALAARVSPTDTGLADRLRENVAGLKVPVPMSQAPERAEALAQRGYVTVVRLPLRSADAFEQARHELGGLDEGDAPLSLFLRRVCEVELCEADQDTERRRTLTRHRVGHGSSGGIRFEHVVLGAGREFMVLNRTVPEEKVLAAIAEGRKRSVLNRSWERWEGDAEVSVGVPLDEPLEQGRLYTFLPMGENTPCPLPAFVNGPFDAAVDRRDLDMDNPLNRLLLDEVAQLCAEAILRSTDGSLDLEPSLALDLASWRSAELPRLRGAIAAAGEEIESVPLLPALGGEARTTLDRGWLWEAPGEVFSPQTVAQTGCAELVDPGIGELRKDRFRALCESVGVSSEPDPDEVAGFAEAVAESLAAEVFDPARWAAFYDDLKASLPSATALHGRRVLLDESQELIAPHDREDGPAVLFPPQQTEDDVSDLRLPGAVRRRLRFFHPDIPRTQATEGRPLRPGRDWLERERLVRGYEAEVVLELVGATMSDAEAGDDELRGECLRFAYDLWRTAKRGVGEETLRAAGLQVPTVGGWRGASDAVFGTGWGGPQAHVDDSLAGLLRRATAVSAELADLAACVLNNLDVIMPDTDSDSVRNFIEQLGVRHGLWPRHVPKRSLALRGDAVAKPRIARRLEVNIPGWFQDEWRAVAERWPRQTPSLTTVDYLPDTDVAVLPGQFDWAELDEHARRDYAELVVHGLNEWPHSALEFRYKRDTDRTRCAWPTFLSAFLSTADWVPQTMPGRRDEIYATPPSRAWWLREGDPPGYLRAPPARLRRRATDTALDRLRKVGVRFWDDPDSAPDRLDELAGLAQDQGAAFTVHMAPLVRSDYERAWRDAIERRPLSQLPELLLVSRSSVLNAVETTGEGEPVYVPDEAGRASDWLRRAPVLVLPLRSAQLASEVRDVLHTHTSTRVRSVAEAEVKVTVDGRSASEALTVPLADVAGPWLPLFVLAAAEHRDERFVRRSTGQLAGAASKLESLPVIVAEDVCATVDGNPIDLTAGHGSFLVADEGGAQRAVVIPHSSDEHWDVLEAASSAMAEFIDASVAADAVFGGLVNLRRRCGDKEPDESDIAAVLGTTRTAVRQLARALSRRTYDVSAVVAVLACIDPDLAEQLEQSEEALSNAESVERWLIAHLSTDQVDAATLVALADAGDLLAAVRQLGVPLADANAGLRALGRQPLHNVSGHQRQLEGYVTRHASQIRDQLRDRFAAAVARGEHLDDYARALHDLRDLPPDPSWLDKHWEVPEEALAAYVDQWLDEVSPGDEPVSGLEPVDALRENARKTISSVLANARRLVDAWLHRHRAGQGPQPGEFHTVVQGLEASGRLDFGPLEASEVIAWLHQNGQWPDDMPRTSSQAELGLTKADMDGARERLRAGHDEQRRQGASVTYKGRSYSDEDAGDLRALADAVRADIADDVLDTPARTLTLPPVSPPTPGTGSSGSSGAGRRRHPQQERTRAVGLAGEVVVAEWLRRQFGQPPEDTWRSRNRSDVLGDDRGDDSLGYDFQVARDDGSRLFVEAKATTGIDTQFELGETEVRCAQSIELPDEYMIAFVPHVLDPARRRVHPLPNPLRRGGLQHFHLVGRALRFEFELENAHENH